MKIIIAGSGEVGYYLAQLLEKKYRDIVMIDVEKEKLGMVEKELGIATVQGDSTSYATLQCAGVIRADLLISVTSDEAANLTTCIIGKKLGAKFTIARISNLEYLKSKNILDLKDLGIDDLISPESLAAREIKKVLKTPVITEAMDIRDGALSLFGVNLDDGAAVIDKAISETATLIPDNSFMVVAVHRKNETIIPNGQTVLRKGDHLYFVSTPDNKEKVLEYAGKKAIQIKNVMIIGGSRTGKYTAMKLSQIYNVKLIEKDPNRCNYLAKLIPKVQIVQGDGTDIQLLSDEHLNLYDAIIAVTGNSETNIFTSMIAREAGVKKTIAMVDNLGLVDYLHKIGIDTFLNKKIAAANFIFQTVHKGSELSQLYGINAEIHEFIIKEKSKFVQKSIKELSIPENSIFIGVVRNNKGLITLGNLKLEAGDTALVLTLPENIQKISSIFK